MNNSILGKIVRPPELLVPIFLLFLFCAQIHCASLSLISPPEDYFFSTLNSSFSSTQIHFELSDPSIYNCYAFLNTKQMAISPNAVAGNEYEFEIYRSSMDVGNNVFQIKCTPLDSAPAGADSIESERISFWYGKPATLTLLSPENTAQMHTKNIDFVFRYNKNDYHQDSALCFLHMGGQTLGRISVPSGAEAVFSIQNMVRKFSYKWFVECNGIFSENRTFEILEAVPSKVILQYPYNRQESPIANPQFRFSYISGDDAPDPALCQLIIGPRIAEQMNLSSGAVAQVRTAPLDEGLYLWYAKCNPQTEYEADSEFYSLKITGTQLYQEPTPIQAPVLNIVNTSEKNISTQNNSIVQNPFANLPQVVLIAPLSVQLNENVSIQLFDDKAIPLSNIRVKITSSGGNFSYILTNSSGIAFFIANEKANYSYSIADHKIIQSPKTQVSKEKTVFENILPSTPEKASNQTIVQNASAQQSIFTSVNPSYYSVFAGFAAGTIFIVLLYFAFFRGKKKKAEEKPNASKK
ncbi:MAG: hypothetical protein WC492_04490 [Candidatus Micrarchaeia archaeon]